MHTSVAYADAYGAVLRKNRIPTKKKRTHDSDTIFDIIIDEKNSFGTIRLYPIYQVQYSIIYCTVKCILLQLRVKHVSIPFLRVRLGWVRVQATLDLGMLLGSGRLLGEIFCGALK